jgi:hypothetical protein
MPIDERWDKLSDSDWVEFAKAWLDEIRTGDDSNDYGGSVTQMEFTARRPLCWKFITLAVEHAQSDEELKNIAAGPVEQLLMSAGDDFIEAMENEAERNPTFARMMTGVWRNNASEVLWARVEAIQAKANLPLE